MRASIGARSPWIQLGRPLHTAAGLLAAFIGSVSILGTLGCATGPIWAEAVPGQVLDKETGAPIAGAAVVSFYSQIRQIYGARNSNTFCHRHAVTDEQGRFRLHGKPCVSLALLHDEEGRFVRVLHPDYGWWFSDSYLFVESDELPLVFRLVREPADDARTNRWRREVFTSPKRWETLCGGGLDDAHCKFLCDWAYGESGHCRGRYY